jgi:hypothetical protein
MSNISRTFVSAISLIAWAFAADVKTKSAVETTAPVLWQAPDDIAARDLFYGSGGKKDEPRGTVTFETEDMNGSNPKFIVRDADGNKWTVKMGNEARPETLASRLVWATGYFTNENYFVADLHVEGLPPHLKRGQNMVTADSVKNVRLKRHDSDEKKMGDWSWRGGSFLATRELNGLRVMMALINNWDLKTKNNAIYVSKTSGDQIYMVTDLGASFGAASLAVPVRRSKDDVEEYEKSTFIRNQNERSVSFGAPGRAAFPYLIAFPLYIHRMQVEWIAHDIPRADAKWIGDILGGLSDAQIRDACRAGGYSPEETDRLATVLESRIEQLRKL